MEGALLRVAFHKALLVAMSVLLVVVRRRRRGRAMGRARRQAFSTRRAR